MAQQTINIGTAPNDGTGDTIRDGGDKINDNFTELYTFDLGLSTSSSPQFAGLNLGHATDTTITRTGAGDIAVEGNAIYRAGGTDVPLADGGTGASLTDPGADRVLFWDESANAVTWLTMGTNLTITGTTLDATGGGGSAIEVFDEGVSETATLVSLDFVGAGVAAVDDGSGNVTVTVSGGGGGSGEWQIQWTALQATTPTTNFASLDSRNNHPVLDFDTTTQETAYFSGVLPPDYAGGGVTVSIFCAATSATSGTIGWDVAFERMDASTLDIDADSFATAQTVTATTVPGTSGQLLKLSVNIANGADMDSLAAGEAFRLRVRRDVANDTATGDAELLRVLMVEQ